MPAALSSTCSLAGRGQSSLPPLAMRTCSLPRAPTTLQRRGSRCAVVTASTTPGLLNRLLNWQPGSGGPGGAVGAARRQLLEQLSSRKPDAASIGEACDALMAAEVPFREADLGGGPFQVAYTRGPLLWALSPSSGGRVSSPTGNQASQDFDPRTRRVINRGQLLGAQLSVSAAGSYEPADAAARCPKLVRASIEGGCLQAWGQEIKLPIRGSGQVYVAYLDPSLRIFKASNGSLSLQVRQQELPRLLGRPAAAP